MNDPKHYNEIMRTLGNLETTVKDTKDDVSEIKTQTKLTNGRVSKLERAMWIVGAVVGTLLISSGSQLISFIKAII